MLEVAAIKSRRDRPGPRRITVDVCIEKVQRDPTYLHPPDREANRHTGLVELDFDHERLAVVVDHLQRRLSPRFQIRDDILLPAIGSQALAQVTLPIEQ